MWKARFRELWLLIKATVKGTLSKDVSLMAAGLAFFALISMAPFLIIAVAVAGAVFGADTAQSELFTRIADELGPKVAQVVVDIVRGAGDLESISIATFVSAIVLFWGSMRLFYELRRALNTLWDVPTPADLTFRHAVLGYLRNRFVAAASVMVFSALFLLLLGSRVTLNILKKVLVEKDILDLPLPVWAFVENIVALAVVAGTIVIVYKLLPARKPSGRHLWIGALVTAGLLLVGRFLVAFYLATGTIESAYGAAGSVVIFLIWAYFSALAFLFGARLTHLIDTGDYRER